MTVAELDRIAKVMREHGWEWEDSDRTWHRKTPPPPKTKLIRRRSKWE